MSPQGRGAGVLGAIASLSSRYSKSVLVVVGLITVVAVAIASRLALDPSLEKYLPAHEPVLQEFIKTERDFSDAQYLLIVIEIPKSEPVIRYQPFIAEYKKRLSKLPGIRQEGININRELAEKAQAYLLEHGMLQMDRPSLEMLSERLKPGALKKQILEQPAGQTYLWKNVFDPLRIYGVVQSIFPLAQKSIFDRSGDFFISADPSLVFFVVSTGTPWMDVLPIKKLREQSHQIEKEAWNQVLPEMQRFYKRSDFKAPHITWIGRHMNTLKTTQSLQNILLMTMILSAVGISVAFLIFFRRIRTLFIAYIPLLCGVVWTFAAASLILGNLNGLTIIAGAILLGLGIDFSVYILNYYYRACHEGQDWNKALVLTWRDKGPSVCFGALTTAAAFFFLQTSKIPIYREVGILAGIGIFMTLIAVLVMTPALIAIIDNVSKARELPAYPRSLVRIPVRHPKWTILFSILVLVVLGVFVKNFRFESPYREAYYYLRQAAVLTTPGDVRFSSVMGVSPLPIRLMVSGDSWEQALEKNDQLARLLKGYADKGAIAFYDSLSGWLPSQKLQNKRYQRIKKLPFLNADLFQKNYNETIASDKKKRGNKYVEYGKKMTQFLNAVEPITPQNMEGAGLQNIMDLYAKEKGQGVFLSTYVYLPRGDYPSQKEALMESLMQEDMFLQGEVRFPSEEQIDLRFRQIISHELLWLALYMMSFTALVMIVSLRSFKMALLASLPMMFGGIAALGAYILILGAMSVFVVPWTTVYVGLATDDAIHICMAAQRERIPLPQVLSHVGSMIVLTSVTTMIGFGSLLFSDLITMQWIGAWICIAMFCELIASLFLLPALLKLFDGDRDAS